jgi:putative membrane protein
MNRMRLTSMYRLLTIGLLTLTGISAQAAALSDEEIMAVVAALNVNEINTAKLAESKAYQATVRQFARKMIKDHRAMDQKAGKLAVRLKLNPSPSTLNEAVRVQGSEIMESLRTAPQGPIFDKDYMATQVQMHEQALNLFETELIPNAKNEKLKALLEQSMKDITLHLEESRKLHEEITANI